MRIKKYLIIFMIICICILLFLGVFNLYSAQKKVKIVKLNIEFSWKGIKKCSNRSPEIRVKNIPPNTKYFKVTLKDLDVPTWNHGGGTVKNNNSGIIPAGSLKDGYNGPCPPSGSHKYEFTVKALDKKRVVLGIGKAVKMFP